MKLKLAVLLAALTLSVATQSAQAAHAGTLNLGGSVDVFVVFGNGTIDFLPAGGTTGTFEILAASDAFYNALDVVGDDGLIKDLPQATFPINTAIGAAGVNFLTFAANPALHFDLTMLLGGVFGAAGCAAPVPAAGQNCSPTGTPFNMTNTGTDSSIVSFKVIGNAVNGAESLPFFGEFSATFSTESFQEILATIAGGGTVRTGFDAEFTVVPEPGTWALMVGGLALMAVRRFRRK